VATWGVYDYLKKNESKTSAVAGQGVLVATGDIPIGTKIDGTLVKTATWPKSNVPPGSMADVNAVMGRVVIQHINAGDIVTEQKLMPKDAGASTGIMTYIVPQGHRAVTVSVNEVAGVAGFISPHNRVDIVLTTTPPGTTEPLSKIVLQNVTILATGQITEQKEGKPVVVPTVTLDLTPDDSEKLVLAASKGPLQLLLRNIVDTAPVEATGATISKVLGVTPRVAAVRSEPKRAPKKATKKAPVIVRQVEAKPAPAPKPAPGYSVEIIKGTSKSSRQFSTEE
jgi:pilus assembly protein CpaB